MSDKIKVPKSVYDAMSTKVAQQKARLDRARERMAEKTKARLAPEEAALAALQASFDAMEP